MQYEKILAAIKKYDTIIIHRHVRPDPDAYGSQVGLAETIRNSYPDKQVYAVGESVHSLAWLTTDMQEVSDDVYAHALVIVTDTADTPRVDDQRFSKGEMLIKIDHHPNDDAYGDVQLVLPDISSTSEVLIDLINGSNGQLKMNAAAARLFYAGIVGDTGRFLYNNTTAHTLMDVAQLYGFDFDPSVVNQQMNEVTMGQAKLQAFAMSDLQVTANGAGYYVIHQSDLKRLGVAPDEYQVAVGTGGRLAEVRAWAMFTEQPEGNYRVSLRSKELPIEPIAKNHNGGGHELASGAKAADEAEIKQIVNELDALLAGARK
ncbi:bifunctional oligoribonuclease/PAP phosphatase NrnA [Lacticaseibacillus pabuli]|uniref:Bifunctional oligoribonuclease/PAP phosphatase NrnA n=1 Tax=Lacticaseibacillus pabuli TaxID=3025672 RepID=A0ABY7WTE6_9LACO|nr:bifunctional oligoribonuclease/PAP phosphatase NrnA [Lacticaseibacillus sp. KACC 23028]WDF83386.1 bifunctional oligoribonuclease/PAP phosphatase NrnA [Lacticaseibacillus sp. KACC 23028]